MLDYEKMKARILMSDTIGDLAPEHKPPVPPCSDSQNYIFISYSHRDYKSVYCDLIELHKAGVRYWYDRGLTPGIDWTDEAREHLKNENCSGVIFYLSENFILSTSTLEEVKAVLGSRKNYFAVSFSDELPEDYISMTIGSRRKSELNALGIDNKRLHEDILLAAFPNRNTNIIKAEEDSFAHITQLLGTVKDRFNVTLETFSDTDGHSDKPDRYQHHLNNMERIKAFCESNEMLLCIHGDDYSYLSGITRSLCGYLDRIQRPYLLYTGKEWVEETIDCIKENNNPMELASRHAPLIILDDIEFLYGKTSTQYEMWINLKVRNAKGLQTIVINRHRPQDVMSIKHIIEIFNNGEMLDCSAK